MSKVFTITEGLENLGALRTGGQGSVYKGRRMGPILSAVKLLPTPIHSESEDDKNFRNFSNEVAKLKRVNEEPHPNVVKILSSGITDSGSLPYIEMEYIEGPDLCELLQAPHEKIFTLQEVIRLAYQLASALAHCHKFGVKHGDIKSNNVKYNVHTGNYVLIDFGLAILSEEERRSSIRHAGAVEFMAPEQSEGHMLMQTDVYSYGIVLYEMLTGQVPFPLGDHTETARNTVLLAHQEAAVPDLIAARKAAMPNSWTEAKQHAESQVPVWLLQTVYKCLQKRPENRFDNGIALQEAIVSEGLSGSGGGGNDVLLAENERLQAELNAQKQADTDKDRQLAVLKRYATETGAVLNPATGLYQAKVNKLQLSKAGFATLVLLLFVFAGLFGYSYIKGSKQTSAGAIYPASAVYLKPPFIHKIYTPKTDDSVVNAIIAAEVKKIVAKQQKRKPAVITPAQQPKKKRKKFLGIF